MSNGLQGSQRIYYRLQLPLLLPCAIGWKPYRQHRDQGLQHSEYQHVSCTSHRALCKQAASLLSLGRRSGGAHIESLLAQQALEHADGGALGGGAADTDQQPGCPGLIHQPDHTLPRWNLSARCARASAQVPWAGSKLGIRAGNNSVCCRGYRLWADCTQAVSHAK